MKVVIAQGSGGPEVLKIEEIDEPKPSVGEVLIKLEVAGVNFADIYARRSAKENTRMGREGAGIVEQVGTGISEFKPGDKVAFSDTIGAYAEKIIVSEKRLVHVPEKLSSEQAAAVLLQGMTAHYLAVSTFPLQEGDIALIHAAAGGVGELLVQIAKRKGATVIGTVSNSEKAKIASQSGADEVIIYTEKDFEAEVKRITDKQGVHVVYDGVGKDTFEKSLNSLRPRGMLVLFGQSSGSVDSFDPSLLAQKGSLFLTRPSLKDYVAEREELLARSSALFKAVAEGSLKVRIYKEFPLEEAAEAQKVLESRETIGKVLLKI